MAVSPDGSRVAFVAAREGQGTIWIRPLDAQSPVSLAATEGASSPFWSPDGASLGFFADGKLKKISLAGGPAQTICDASGKNAGAWGRTGTILFTQYFSPKDGLYSVSASGGAARPISIAYDEIRWPYFFPDGRRFLFLGWSPKDDAFFLLAGALDSPEVHRVAPLQSRAELSRNGETLLCARRKSGRQGVRRHEASLHGRRRSCRREDPVFQSDGVGPLRGFGDRCPRLSGLGCRATTSLGRSERADSRDGRPSGPLLQPAPLPRRAEGGDRKNRSGYGHLRSLDRRSPRGR